jgi:hypothetical protein
VLEIVGPGATIPPWHAIEAQSFDDVCGGVGGRP